MYDAVANAWSELTANGRGITAPGRYAHSLVLMTDAEQMLVFGGWHPFHGTSNQVFELDLAPAEAEQRASEFLARVLASGPNVRLPSARRRERRSETPAVDADLLERVRSLAGT